MRTVQVIPTPKEAAVGAAVYTYPATVAGAPQSGGAVEAFVEYAGKMGLHFTVCAAAAAAAADATDATDAAFRLRTDATLAEGAYRLQTGADGVVLESAGEPGFHHAFATVLQLLCMQEPRGGDGCTVRLPACTIADAPDCAYRGMMVDLARNWHDISYLYSYVDMCYFYKVSVLHLHFTDDQSYTLPSRLFPELSTKGRHYTQEEIAAVAAYARDRGVELMPEIDVPGHCVSFQSAYPEIFGKSGILCQHAESMRAMRALFTELCGMFPYSRCIHIGGDEAAIRNWTECAECRAYAASLGLDPDGTDPELLAQQLYANFVTEMAEAVRAEGRQPVVWEGFAKSVNERVPKDILVMSWENFYQVTPDLLEGGFRILNCSWNPMYIVAPEPVWPTREVYDWSIYAWKPVHGSSPYLHSGYTMQPDSRVLGGQLLAWGDRIASRYPTVEEGVAAERILLTERLPYLAENTWNVNKRDSYENLEPLAQALNAKLRALAGIA